MALIREGQLKLNQPQFRTDLRPIDENCDCSTCKHYSRAYLNQVVRFEGVGASLVTVHNVAFQVKTNIHFQIMIYSIFFVRETKMISDFLSNKKLVEIDERHSREYH